MCFIKIVLFVFISSPLLCCHGDMWSLNDWGSVMKKGTKMLMSPLVKPMVWMKDVAVTQVHNYRFSEFSSCLSKNETGFDLTKVVNIDEEPDRFMSLHRPWNLRQKTNDVPLAYVLPQTPADVQTLVRCGVQSGARLVPNAGGLSFESISWGNPHSVVVDFRNMRGIQIDEDTVTVQPGAMVGHIHAHLWRHGFGLPLSSHLTAGMAGDALGGGHGVLSSLVGLTVDQIMAVDVVTVFGDLRHVTGDDSAESRDLWWALRGMGAGYVGIVTAIKLKMFKVTDLKLTFASVRFPMSDFVQGFESFQNFHQWAEDNSATISRTLYLTNDESNHRYGSISQGVTIELVHFQDPTFQPDSSATFVAAVNKIFTLPADISITTPTYLEFVTATGYAPIDYPTTAVGQQMITARQALQVKGHVSEDDLLTFLENLSKDLYTKRYFKLKSMFVNRLVTFDELEDLDDTVATMPPWTLIQLTGQTGAVGAHARNENAYVHRNSTFNLSVRYEGTKRRSGASVGMDWLKEFWAQVQFLDGGETYQNFVDLDIQPLTEMVTRFYKLNQGKLVDCKRKWDPENYFQTAVSLPIFLS